MFDWLVDPAASAAAVAVGGFGVKAIDWLITRRQVVADGATKNFDSVSAAHTRLTESLFKQNERMSAELERISSELEEEAEKRFKAERKVDDLERQLATVHREVEQWKRRHPK